VSRRASLPGADELFRRTSGGQREPAPEQRQEAKSTSLQVAETAGTSVKKGPKHQEKITFYCTGDDLMAIEQARLGLRAHHRIAADRGRIVRAALAYVLEDFEARGDDSVLVRQLRQE
jgi:hypothetical protein